MTSRTPGGSIVTFYSYKGGTGRTMALANVAWILAANGNRVLVVDWDLEAPGLHRYFLPFMDDPDLKQTGGLIEMVSDYLFLLTRSSDRPPGTEEALDVADPRRYAVALQFEFEGDGTLHLLGAGRQDIEYAERVRGLDWHKFYVSFRGNDFIETLAKKMRSHYDYVLVDSRTGVADMAGICTMQLPDQLVLCFTYNRQSMEGVAAVAQSVAAYALAHPRSVTILPLPTRVVADVEGMDDAREFAQTVLAPFLPQLTDRDALLTYWGNAEVPHYPAYGFEETLATFRERAGGRNNMLADMEWLTGQISQSDGPVRLPHMKSDIRAKYLNRFRLRDPRQAHLAEILQKEPTLALRELASLGAEAAQQLSDPSWRSSLTDALDQLAIESQSSGRWEEALAATEEAVVIRRDLAAAGSDTSMASLATSLNNLATTLGTLGRHEAALEATEEALAIRRELALARPDAFTPDLAISLSNRATTLSAMGQREAALAATREATDLYHGLAASRPDTFGPELAMSLMSLATRLSDVGKFDEALVVLERLFYESPSDSELAARYAEALQKAGRHEEALHVLERAFHEFRRDPRLATRYAQALQKTGSEGEALDVLEGAFHEFRRDPRLATGYAEALQKAGRHEEALDVLERAFHEFRRDPRLAARYAGALQKAGRHEEAIHVLERAVYQFPPQPDLVILHAEALQKAGRYGEAIHVLERAVYQFPPQPELAIRHAEALQKAGRHEEAVNVLERAFYQFPPLPELAIRHAEALQKAGRYDEAIHVLERAFYQFPAESELATRFAEALQGAGREDEAVNVLRQTF
jgi:tetratricopeptide (TPR) repeat protein